MLVGWATYKFAPDSDYWFFNKEGWDEHHRLVKSPLAFIRNITYSYYDTHNNFFGSENSFWNDLRGNILIKSIAILDLFTGGNYYINSIFFNLFGFFGCLALYRTFADVYPLKKIQVAIGCFLLPSTLLFSSGIHKDVVVFSMVAFYCYLLYFSLKEKFTFKRILLLVLTLLLILLMRSYVMIALIPASFAWIACAKKRVNPWVIFPSVYAGCVLLLSAMQLVRPSFQPLTVVTARQQAFFALPQARSQVALDTLQPAIGSFIENAPQALNNAVAKPYLFEFPGLLYLNAFALEVIIYGLLLLLMIVFYERHRTGPFPFFTIAFAFTIFMLVGYIVPNAGSIVRYRSIFYPLLLVPVFCHINFKKLRRKK